MELVVTTARSPLRRARVRLAAAVGALVVVACAPAALAQDTTYIGGGGSPGGQQVIVNLDAINGGSAPSRRGNAASEEDRDFAGELVESPTGVLLRFPPHKPPHSHLTVDPDDLDDSQSGQPRRPSVKPALTPPEEPTRTTVEKPRTTAVDTAPKPDPMPAHSEQRTTERADAGTDKTMRETPRRKPKAPSSPTTEIAKTAPTMDAQEAPSPPPPPSEARKTATDTTPEREAPEKKKQKQETTSAARTTDVEPAKKPEPAEEPATETQASEPDAAETQTARRTEGDLPEQVRLAFASGSADLDAEEKRTLDALAERLKEDERQRIQLMAFAEGTEDTASRARRLSLSRALAVRSYLIDRGIRSTRMDVRALGSSADSGPMDRVDIIPAER